MNIQEQALIQRNDVIGDKDHTLFLSEIQVKMYIYIQLQILSKNSYHKVNVLREAHILEPNANPAFEFDEKMELVGFHSFLALNQSFIISVKLLIIQPHATKGSCKGRPLFFSLLACIYLNE